MAVDSAMQQKPATISPGAGAAPARRSWYRALLAPARRRSARRGAAQRPLALALQGGGSFGAFTWGVLDRMLEEDGIVLDAISGASAGAVNAVILANGLAAGGPQAARAGLRRFWKRVSDASPLAPFGSFAHTAAIAGSSALDLSARVFSPYQLNPLGLNPLRRLLTAEVDFERLRRSSPVRLLVAATRVRDGQLRLFREDEITLEAVLASACLPQISHAVEIDGECYWDGGYSANPPLRELVVQSHADDIVLVQLTPERHEGVPRLSRDITRRLSQITFNGPLRREMEALADLCELCQRERFFRSRLCRRIQRFRLHRIAAEHAVEMLAQASPLNLDWSFLSRLEQRGYDAAARWLAGEDESEAGALAAANER